MTKLTELNDVILKPLHKKDIKQVLLLLQDVSIYNPKIDDVIEAAKLIVNGHDAYACVAKIGNRVIGFGSIFCFQRIRGGKSAIIEDMVVDKQYRGYGIGKRVLRELLMFANNEGCFKVSLEASPTGKKFYESEGFVCGNITMKSIINNKFFSMPYNCEKS